MGWQEKLKKFVLYELVKAIRSAGVMLAVSWCVGSIDTVSSSLVASASAYGMFSVNEREVPRETFLTYLTRATVNVLISLIGNCFWVIAGGRENVYSLMVENFKRRDPIKMGRIFGRLADQTGLPQVVFVALLYVIIFGCLGAIKNFVHAWITCMRGRRNN